MYIKIVRRDDLDRYRGVGSARWLWMDMAYVLTPEGSTNGRIRSGQSRQSPSYTATPQYPWIDLSILKSDEQSIPE